MVIMVIIMMSAHTDSEKIGQKHDVCGKISSFVLFFSH